MKVMKRINNYYYKTPSDLTPSDLTPSDLTEEHVVIIGNVQRLIELRDDVTYDDLSR